MQIVSWSAIGQHHQCNKTECVVLMDVYPLVFQKCIHQKVRFSVKVVHTFLNLKCRNNYCHHLQAFDWVDEIELPIQKSNSNAGKLKSLSILSASEDYSSMDTIVLPGGCVITAFQLQELQMFRKHGHVDTW